jgi:O-antigen/teichoic acid export membrane protein
VTSRQRRRILGAALLVAVAIWVSQVATFLLNLVAAPALGPAGFGELASLLGVVAIGNVVALALQAVVARRLVTASQSDRPGAGRYALRVAVPWGLAVAGIALVLTPVAVAVLDLTSPVDMLLVALSLAPLTVTGSVLGVAQGRERAGLLALAYLVAGLGKSLGGITGALLEGTVRSTLLGFALGALVGAALGVAVVSSLVRAESVRLARMRTEVAHAAHALAALFVLTNIDLLLARALLDPVQAGLYAAGAIVAKVAFWLPQAIVVVAFPRMADERRNRSLVLGSAAIVVLGLGLVVATAALPGLVVGVVGGSAYAALEPDVWRFALLGSAQSLAQFLLYSRLAVDDRSAVIGLWATVGVLGFGVWFGPHASVTDIVTTATVAVVGLCLYGAILARRELRQPASSAVGSGQGPGT